MVLVVFGVSEWFLWAFPSLIKRITLWLMEDRSHIAYITSIDPFSLGRAQFGASLAFCVWFAVYMNPSSALSI